MKHIKKIFAIALAAVMLLSCVPSAFAATHDTATIDMTKKASLTLYAFDWTNAYKDGVVNHNTFTSSGWQDSVVEDTFINTTPTGGAPEQVLGNSQTSNGYAVKGVEFTIANIAKLYRVEQHEDWSQPSVHETRMVYLFDSTKAVDFLEAIGLDESDRYVLTGPNSVREPDFWAFTSDVIIDALANALENNATKVKNAMEAYVKENDGIAMDLTDENGRTSVDELELGLYLVVETAVPEMVTSTTNPFLISLPMTTVNNNTEGTAPEGGHEWNYDVTVYPKSASGIPSLEKGVRESESDTGASHIFDTDGFGNNATGSAGDTMEYQIISTLPTITSQATALSTYNFFDTIAPGMTYNQDVKIDIYADQRLTQKVATWPQGDSRFAVSYSDDGHTMTIDITEEGLAEINGDTVNSNGKLYAGYSNYTVVVTYSAEINSDTSFVYGEEGNCNKVVLTWKRTSDDYYDTLIDDTHVYSFGLNMSKLFSDLTPENADTEGKYEHVKFVIKNTTDDYWVLAELNEAESIYYVTGFTQDPEQATIFPNFLSRTIL